MAIMPNVPCGANSLFFGKIDVNHPSPGGLPMFTCLPVISIHLYHFDLVQKSQQTIGESSNRAVRFGKPPGIH
jgi:hypothetical protein